MSGQRLEETIENVADQKVLAVLLVGHERQQIVEEHGVARGERSSVGGTDHAGGDLEVAARDPRAQSQPDDRGGGIAAGHRQPEEVQQIVVLGILDDRVGEIPEQVAVLFGIGRRHTIGTGAVFVVAPRFTVLRGVVDPVATEAPGDDDPGAVAGVDPVVARAAIQQQRAAFVFTLLVQNDVVAAESLDLALAGVGLVVVHCSVVIEPVRLFSQRDVFDALEDHVIVERGGGVIARDAEPDRQEILGDVFDQIVEVLGLKRDVYQIGRTELCFRNEEPFFLHEQVFERFGTLVTTHRVPDDRPRDRARQPGDLAAQFDPVDFALDDIAEERQAIRDAEQLERRMGRAVVIEDAVVVVDLDVEDRKPFALVEDERVGSGTHVHDERFGEQAVAFLVDGDLVVAPGQHHGFDADEDILDRAVLIGDLGLRAQIVDVARALIADDRGDQDVEVHARGDVVNDLVAGLAIVAAADQDVAPAAALQRIVAVAAFDHVVAVAAIEIVGPARADQQVTPGRALDLLGVAVAGEDIDVDAAATRSTTTGITLGQGEVAAPAVLGDDVEAVEDFLPVRPPAETRQSVGRSHPDVAQQLREKALVGLFEESRAEFLDVEGFNRHPQRICPLGAGCVEYQDFTAVGQIEDALAKVGASAVELRGDRQGPGVLDEHVREVLLDVLATERGTCQADAWIGTDVSSEEGSRITGEHFAEFSGIVEHRPDGGVAEGLYPAVDRRIGDSAIDDRHFVLRPDECRRSGNLGRYSLVVKSMPKLLGSRHPILIAVDFVPDQRGMQRHRMQFDETEVVGIVAFQGTDGSALNTPVKRQKLAGDCEGVYSQTVCRVYRTIAVNDGFQANDAANQRRCARHRGRRLECHVGEDRRLLAIEHRGVTGQPTAQRVTRKGDAAGEGICARADDRAIEFDCQPRLFGQPPGEGEGLPNTDPVGEEVQPPFESGQGVEVVRTAIGNDLFTVPFIRNGVESRRYVGPDTGLFQYARIEFDRRVTKQGSSRELDADVVSPIVGIHRENREEQISWGRIGHGQSSDLKSFLEIPRGSP